MNKKSKLIFWGFLLVSIGLTIFIFSNSLQAGEESSAQSDVITDMVGKVLSKIGITPDRDTLSHFVRKLAHFSEYFALGLSSTIALYQLQKKYYTSFAPIYCAATAICDEFIMQAMTEGRGPNWKDVLIDSSGALTALAFVLIFSFIKSKSTKRKI